MKRTKVAVIDNSVTSGAVREYLETHFEVIYVTRQIFLNDRAQILKCNRIIWIHVETLIYARDLESMNSDTILVSTTTGFTHIAKEVISFLGSRFISLKLESDFLKSITSTAELALTFVLMGLTGVQTARADVLKGNWNRLGNVRAKQVSSATAGIIGYGRLGRILASYLRPIVSKVVIWDIDSRACSQAQIDGFEISTNLERLISVSDVVSLHASVIPEQDPIIHKRTLIEAKPGLVLVNTSRGSLVCEEDIVWGVNCGVLQSYWTDVLSCEESGENLTSSKLWQESLVDDRICITPHIGGASKDAIEKCEMQLALRLKNAI